MQPTESIVGRGESKNFRLATEVYYLFNTYFFFFPFFTKFLKKLVIIKPIDSY